MAHQMLYANGHERRERAKRRPNASSERRRLAADQFAAFCFSFAMIVRYVIDAGGALPLSVRNAVQASFFDVARIRAEPLLVAPPRLEFTLIQVTPPRSEDRG